MAFVKLRYKAPGSDTSKLIERAVPAGLVQSARAPAGDMAFITAVAAFGQRLRGDKYLNGFSYPQIGALAPASQNYWRSEFAKLVRLADSGHPAGGTSDWLVALHRTTLCSCRESQLQDGTKRR